MQVIPITKTTFLIRTSSVKAIVRRNFGWIIRKKGGNIEINNQINLSKHTIKKYLNHLIEYRTIDHYFI